MTAARVAVLAQQLGQHKRLAVGEASPLSSFPEGSLSGSEATFKSVVTAVWTWYSELMRHDLQFLRVRATQSERADLGEFTRLLDDQRHFNEHAGYDRANEAQAWREARAVAGAPSDGALVEALLDELAGALATFCQVAGRVRQSKLDTEAWRNHVAKSPKSEMRAVLTDIGNVAFPERRLDYAVRRFTGHRALNRARTPADRARIAALIAVEINLKPLSVQYDRVLDEFALIGDPRGHALLLVAHGAEAVGHRGDRLMEVLRKAWTEMQLDTR